MFGGGWTKVNVEGRQKQPSVLTDELNAKVEEDMNFFLVY